MPVPALLAKQRTLQDLFGSYIKSEPIFINKDSLTAKYLPSEVPHRDKQMETLASILAPALRCRKPSNIFIYGKTGTGKTLVCQHVMDELEKKAKEMGVRIKSLYVNCKMKRVSDTEYRLIAYLCQMLGKEVPATGLPTQEVYKTFLNLLKEEKGVVILILDEVDALVEKVGDDLLYVLTRLDSEVEGANISIMGISNDLNFTTSIGPRVKSSLGQEEILFPPYDANQLNDILQKRAGLAFRSGSVPDGVISKCAALAAQEHGDARRALNLLRVAGEIAEREAKTQISEDHVDGAQAKINTDHVLEAVKAQPKQSKAVLLAVLMLADDAGKPIFTRDVLDNYAKICRDVGLVPLTSRRINDLICELGMLGIIRSQVISRGRHGRTTTISLSIESKTMLKTKKHLMEEFYI